MPQTRMLPKSRNFQFVVEMAETKSRRLDHPVQQYEEAWYGMILGRLFFLEILPRRGFSGGCCAIGPWQNICFLETWNRRWCICQTVLPLAMLQGTLGH